MTTAKGHLESIQDLSSARGGRGTEVLGTSPNEDNAASAAIYFPVKSYAYTTDAYCSFLGSLVILIEIRRASSPQ